MIRFRGTESAMYVRHIIFATHLQTPSKFFINIWNGILFVSYVYWQRDIYIYICNNIYISPIPIFSFCDYQMYLVDDWFATNKTLPEVCPCKRTWNYLSNRIEKPTVDQTNAIFDEILVLFLFQSIFNQQILRMFWLTGEDVDLIREPEFR